MANREKTGSAKKTKPASTPKPKTAPAKKAKPEPVKKPKTASAKKTKPEPVKQQPSRSHAHADGKDLLRRAAIVMLALVMAGSIVLTAFSARSELLQKKLSMFYAGVLQKDNITAIRIDDGQVQKNVQALKRHGQTRKFSYFCNSTLQLDEDSMTGFILFGNPEYNDCQLVLTIMDEDDNVIYRSGGVVPGKMIAQIRLSSVLEKGSYACRAYVSAFVGQGLDYKCIGVQYSHLKVEVGAS